MPNMKIKHVKRDENVSAYCSPKELFTQFKSSESLSTNSCPGIYDWETIKEFAYGHAFSLYEKDLNSNTSTGDPIADAFAIVTYQSCSILSLADGVSWGKKSKLSSNSAIYGATIYLCKNIDKCFTTKDVFKHILDAFKSAQEVIVDKEATLTTLCVGVVVQLQEKKDRWALCVINVGDSYAYFYNKKTGVKEVTCGSHPIGKERDMRFSGGSLGPADGFNPDLGNLTCSFVIIEKDDIVFLCSDGISDNYDPAIAMFNPKTDNISNSNKTKNTKSNDNNKLTLYNNRLHSRHKKNENNSNNCYTNNNSFIVSSQPYYSHENFETQHYLEENTKTECNYQEHLINLQKINNEPQELINNKDKFKQNQTKFDEPPCEKSSIKTTKSRGKNEENLLENENCKGIPLNTFSTEFENKHPEKINKTECNFGLNTNEIKNESKSETDISSSVILDTIHLTPHERQDGILNRMTKVINQTDFDEPLCEKSSIKTTKSREKNEENLLENENCKGIPLNTFSTEFENKHPEKINKTECNFGLNTNEIKNESKSETDISSSVILDTIHLTPYERQDGILNRMTKVINEESSKNSDEGEVVTAGHVCRSISNFVVKRTEKKRNVLEKLQMETKNSPNEKKNKNNNIKKILEDVPGKLDHASIVAYQVGLHKKEILMPEKLPIRKASIQFDSIQKIKGDESRRKSLGDVLG
ncbi:putative uncharacterized protein DDB_G0282133 isoform X2 [Hydra vulgaris]